MIDGRIYLFGTLQFIPGDAAASASLEIGSNKLQALLAYLVLHPHEPLSRSRLAGLLWPEAAPSAARRNLREYLYRARHLLADFRPGAAIIDTDDNVITCTPPAGCWIDVVEFERLVAQTRTAPAPLPADELIARLRQVTDLYRGDLLTNLYDDWIIAERDRLRGLFVDNLDWLSRVLQAGGYLAEAIAVTRRLLEYDPFHEEDHRRLMELYYASGDRARALQQYESCRQLLAEELAAEPMPETLALYQALFNPAPLTAGGRAAPAMGEPLLRHEARPAFATPQDRPSFVGRQAELAHLGQALTGSGINLVTGAAGLGKTRLVTEWLAALPRETVILAGQGHEFEQDIPYRPLLDAVQQSLPRLPWSNLPPDPTYTWLAPLAHLLPDLYYYLPDLAHVHPETGGETGHMMMEGLAQLILSFAHRQPVVLFIDDLHWAGLPTWHCLRFLARRVRPAPVCIVGAFSTSEAGRDQRAYLRSLTQAGAARLLPLSPLGPADTTRLVSEMLGVAPEKIRPLARRLQQEAEGNPFIIIETVKFLAESGLIPPYRPEHLAGLPLPPAIRTVVENRLDRLKPGSRLALAAAAVIGRAFDFSLLAAVSDTAADELLDYLDDWLARGLVVETPGDLYDFSHPRLRDVAEAGLSRARRRHLQSRIVLATARSVGAAQILGNVGQT